MEKIKIGDKFKTNEGYFLVVLKYVDARNVHVSFEDGNIIIVEANQLRKGQIRNVNHKSVYGIGYVGCGKYSHKNNKRSYHVWRSMLERCYVAETQLKQPTYIGCTVVKEWHNFQTFADWYELNYIDNFQIDKDLLLRGNKIYSPDNCCFLPSNLNKIIAIERNKESELPTGITQQFKKFQVKLNIEYGLRVNESFEFLDEAVNFYKETKENYIKRLADRHKHILPTKTYKALLNWQV